MIRLDSKIEQSTALRAALCLHARCRRSTMAGVESSIISLLSSLTDSLTSSTSSFPADFEALLPPEDGISLLDTKNELLLSYIQNLVFLIILKLKSNNGKTVDDDAEVRNATVKKLAELRVYTERGVRPLEGRLKYQTDKVLRAADESSRSLPRLSNGANGKIKNTAATDSNDEVSDSDADDTVRAAVPDELSYRPNPAALIRKPDATKDKTVSSPRKDATYKPPRITPTAMPRMGSSIREERDSRRQRKSHLLDEYVSNEMSSAPLAEPSIGSNSTILNRGRGSLSARQREKQQERTDYEERNLARLPGESKAEKRKAKARGEGVRRNEYGGEDWTGLGEVGDRVARSVGRSRDGARSVLERRQKRPRNDMDGSGLGIGDNFEKRRRVLESRNDKQRRRC